MRCVSGDDRVLNKATAPPELSGGAVFFALSSAALLKRHADDKGG